MVVYLVKAKVSAVLIVFPLSLSQFPRSWILYIYIYIYHHHQSVLPNYRSFTANPGTKAAVLPKVRSSATNSGTKVAFLLGINRCGSFPLLSASPLSL